MIPIIQEDLLREVVSTLQQQLNYDLLTHMRKKPRVNLTAYEHWLYGMEELKKGTLEADEKARTHFQQAMAIDPNEPLAYFNLGNVYLKRGDAGAEARLEAVRVGLPGVDVAFTSEYPERIRPLVGADRAPAPAPRPPQTRHRDPRRSPARPTGSSMPPATASPTSPSPCTA